MKEKAITVLRGLLTPKTIILALALYNFLVVWVEAKKWGSNLICYICPWYDPWSFTNEPTRLLLAACGLCLSMRWGYLAACVLSGFTLFEGIYLYVNLVHDGILIESWAGMWRYGMNPLLSLHAQYMLAGFIFMYAAVCLGKDIMRRSPLRT